MNKATAYPYDPDAKPWNAGTRWSKMALRDLKAPLEGGDTVEEAAMYLHRGF
jgi:hypothetical protein